MSDKDIIGITTYNVTPDRVRIRLSSIFMSQMKVLYLIDCPLLLQSRVFLFRRAKTACRRRTGHAFVVFHRQRHAWRLVVQECGWCRTLIHFLQAGKYPIHTCEAVNSFWNRARRNENGHLVPDAPEDVVQSSLGFSKYEHASHDKSSDTQGTSIADTNSSS